jgi:hypothetical protein
LRLFAAQARKKERKNSWDCFAAQSMNSWDCLQHKNEFLRLFSWTDILGELAINLWSLQSSCWIHIITGSYLYHLSEQAKFGHSSLLHGKDIVVFRFITEYI